MNREEKVLKNVISVVQLALKNQKDKIVDQLKKHNLVKFPSSIFKIELDKLEIEQLRSNIRSAIFKTNEDDSKNPKFQEMFSNYKKLIGAEEYQLHYQYKKYAPREVIQKINKEVEKDDYASEKSDHQEEDSFIATDEDDKDGDQAATSDKKKEKKKDSNPSNWNIMDQNEQDESSEDGDYEAKESSEGSSEEEEESDGGGDPENVNPKKKIREKRSINPGDRSNQHQDSLNQDEDDEQPHQNEVSEDDEDPQFSQLNKIKSNSTKTNHNNIHSNPSKRFFVTVPKTSNPTTKPNKNSKINLDELVFGNNDKILNNKIVKNSNGNMPNFDNVNLKRKKSSVEGDIHSSIPKLNGKESKYQDDASSINSKQSINQNHEETLVQKDTSDHKNTNLQESNNDTNYNVSYQELD